MDTHGELNLDPTEGLNTSLEMSTFYLPQVGGGRVIRIDYDPSDGWWVDTDGYVKLDPGAQISLDRVSMVSPIIEGRFVVEPHNLGQSHPELFGNTMRRST